jgi:hypothetical protein
MSEKAVAAQRLNRCPDVEHVEEGITDSVVKFGVESGEYNSVTPEMLDALRPFTATITPVNERQVDYYVVLE